LFSSAKNLIQVLLPAVTCKSDLPFTPSCTDKGFSRTRASNLQSFLT
jgi:hypothetical protein